MYHYKAPENSRKHIEACYRKLDVKFDTLRTRPCNTLVLTKTRDSYERREKQYEVDRRVLAHLEKDLRPASLQTEC